MRIISAGLLFGLVSIAPSGCARIAHRSTAATTPSIAVTDKQQPGIATCTTCAAAKDGVKKYPVSAFIAYGPRLEKHDEATGPVTLGRNHTVVYRSAVSGEQVEVREQCEVRFVPTSLARSEH